MGDSLWTDALVPAELSAFLRGIKLEHLGVKLVELGYDDVDGVGASL